MTAYYNEIDPYAAQWLRNLIDAGHIARGDVDERSIIDVRADDIRGYTQAHFFAGIGGWSLALRLAGWPDDRPVWTGSCPCQPFSAAGAGKAANDERHLWPAWLPLIAERRPAIVFGEQVEAAVGWGWLDAVFADLEAEGYACGAAVLPACSVGAPHIRQRLWFVADAESGDGRLPVLAGRPQQKGAELSGSGKALPLADASRRGAGRDVRDAQRAPDESASAWHQHRVEISGQPFAHSAARDLADAAGGGFGELGYAPQPRRGGHDDGGGEPGGMGHSAVNGSGTLIGQSDTRARRQEPARGSGVPRFWSDAEWIACTDGKSRPVGPGSFPLGHGIRNRASKLRAYGNAIVPQTAAEFIRAASA